MILRTCLCIPSYNNPTTIHQVIRDCLKNTKLPILLVDDGSEPAVSLPPLQEYDQKRIRIIRFNENRGKGSALQAAMKDGIQHGFTHLLTLDADGQHLSTDIPKLLAKSRENPWDLVIGSRRMSGENVPGSSRFGRNFSNFWVRYETDVKIADSQSGFRIYPLFHLQNMRFLTRRFDFEIEVLIRLLWKGVGIHEVEIDVVYPKPSERVSHFRMFRDNVRISCLNTILVILSLLKEHHSPLKTGIAVGLGVFVGSTPFFGFHTLIAAGLALLFRLNAVALILGTQISIPPVAPFLASASIAVGIWILGSSFRDPLQMTGAWLLGCVPVGITLGSVFGLVTWGIARLLRDQNHPTRKHRSAWSGKTRGGRFGNWFLKKVTQTLGLRAAYFCLYFIVPYFYLFAPKARSAADEYWQAQRPGTGWFHRQLLVLQQMLIFAKILIDRVYQSQRDQPCFEIRENGMRHILEPLKSGQGLILLGAHIGSLDMGALMLGEAGLPGEFYKIHYQAEGMTFERARGGQDPKHLKNLGVNRVSQPLLQIRELLSAGKAVGLMGDRPLANHFELVPFLGRLTPLDGTPFKIAAACGQPLTFVFGFKGNGRSYEMSATPSRIYTYQEGSDRLLQCTQWIAEFASDLENAIRTHPEQWFNFYRIFSTLPSAPDGVEVSKGRNYLIEELYKPEPV